MIVTGKRGARGMRKWMIVGAMLAATPACAQVADEAAIRALEAGHEAAWNAHDVAAWISPMAPDAQFITARGGWWHDRAEIERAIDHAFQTSHANSHLHIDRIEVTSLSANAAVVYVVETLDSGDGAPHHLIQSQTLRKTAGAWQIASTQETTIVPKAPTTASAETPTPKPPAPPKRCFLANSKGECIITKK
jgi:uncharacterized protein (TIGR02246 family)